MELEMKKKLLSCFAFILSIVLCLSGNCVGVGALPEDSAAGSGDSAAAVLENGKYKMSFNEKDGSFRLENKSTGYVRYSNPPEAEGNFADDISSQLNSQLFVYYYKEHVITLMDSYSACVPYENSIKITKDGDSVSVLYSMGQEKVTVEMLPYVISKDRLEKDILSKLDDYDKEEITERYKLYSKKKMSKDLIESIRTTLPVIDKHDIYIRQSIPNYKIKSLYEIFQKTGYTSEDLQKDCDENGVENKYEESPHFEIALKYTLTEDGFNVTAKPGEFVYKEAYKPVRICVLPYFGAASSKESGYMLVPDGCGAVIEFNNGKTREEGYWKEFFGEDRVYTKATADYESEASVLPMFALSNSNAGFLASIEKGYEAAGISADISGKLNDYNFVYPFFNLYSADEVALTSNSFDKFILYNKKIFSSDISIDYHLTDTYKTYSEFADLYRGILEKNNILPDGNTVDSAVLDVNFIGSAAVTKKFLGIPYKSTAAYTTFKQANDIVTGLDGIKTDVNYLCALKGGAKPERADKINLSSVLGGKSSLEKLGKSVNSLSFSIYAQSAAKLSKNDRVISLGNSTARALRYDIVSRQKAESMFYLVAPCKLPEYAGKIVKSAKKNNISGINLLDIGYMLTSDFNENSDTDRYGSKQAVQKYMEKLAASADLSAERGSIFSLKYLSKISSIPTASSGYGIEDYAVPFYQEAVSGKINYSVSPLNSAASARDQFLKAVETGARLQYTWYAEKPENTVNAYENYYGYDYKSTFRQAVEYFKEYSELAKKLSGHKIAEHLRISDSLMKTVWDNGITVYVNYSDTEQSADGISIKAKGFSIKE